MQENSTPSDGERMVEPGGALPLAGAWRRYAALYVDFAVVGVPLVLLLAAVGGLDMAGSALMVAALIPPVLTFLILGLCAAAFEVFGNTAGGKALLGLQVVTVTGTRPTFAQFASRQRALFLQGLCAGIPLVSFIGQALQFGRVASGRPTTYDRGKFSVVARPFGAVRTAIFCLAGISLVAGLSYLQSMESWKNPVTGVKAHLPTGWVVREVKRDKGDLMYVFASSTHQVQGMVWRDHQNDELAATVSQGGKVAALKWRGLKDEAVATIAGKPAIALSGAMEVDSKLRPVEVTLLRDGADLWQFTAMGESGRPLDLKVAHALRDSVFQTLRRDSEAVTR